MDNSRQNAQLSNPRNPKKLMGACAETGKFFGMRGQRGCLLAAPGTGVKMAKRGVNFR